MGESTRVGIWAMAREIWSTDSVAESRTGSVLTPNPSPAGRGESAGGETCPCGGGRARGEESAGGETCPMRGRVSVGRGKSVGEETCPCGEGGRGERRVCWR